MKNKLNYIIFIILFLLSAINILFIIHFGFVFGGDQSLPNYYNGLYFSLFAYSNRNYTGLLQSVNSVWGLILGLITNFAAIFTNYYFSGDILYLFEIFLGGVGIFLLVSTFTENFGYFISKFSGFVASLLFILHYQSTNNGLSILVMFFPYVILFAYYMIKNNECNKNFKINYYNLSLFIIFLSFFIASGGGTYILQNLILIILLLLLLVLFNNYKIKLFFNFLISVVIALLINFSWMLTTYIFTNEIAYKSFFNQGSVSTLNAVKINFIQDIIPFSKFDLISLFILILSFLSIYFVYKNKFDKIKSNFILSIFILMIIFIGIMATITPPFGILFSAGIKAFKYLLVLRYPYTALHYIFVFIYSFLAAISIGSILYYVKSKGKNFITIIALAMIILFVAGYLYQFNYSNMPNYNPKNVNLSQVTKIPKNVTNLADYINKINGIYSVATLPMAANWQSTTWYIGTNVYSSLINKPVYTGSYTTYNEIFFPISTSLYNNYVGSNIDNSNISDKDISNGLGVFGIHYIAVQGDAIHKSLCSVCYISSFSFKTIYSNLNNSNDIKFVKKFGNSSLYENINYVPLIYASNIQNIDNASPQSVFNLIENKSFNIKNNSVFTTYIKGFYNDSNTINASRIENFKEPEINFTYNNPTMATVKIRNATTPFYLVFRETYGTHWHAYINGKLVPLKDHIAVNGFANAWYLNKTGNYTITIYYTQQTYAWIAFAVSFAALFATIGLGVYGWIENKKVKPVKSRIIHAKDLEV